MTTHAGEISMSSGVMRPMRTTTATVSSFILVRRSRRNAQLFNHTDAVEIATPLLLTDNGNTSEGRTHPMGPIEIPYAMVKT